MIVESMTYQEIAEAIKHDWKQELYDDYNSCFGKREWYGLYVERHVKAEEYHFFDRKGKVTRGKNKYVFLFYTHGLVQYRRLGIIRNLRLEYLRSDGIHAVKFNPFNLKEFTFYTPHFFERYRDRFLSKIEDTSDMILLEVMDKYYLNNEVFYGQPQNNPKYPDGIFMSMNDGVALGVDLGDGIWEYRTYISSDMLKGKQVDKDNEDFIYLDQVTHLFESGKVRWG